MQESDFTLCVSERIADILLLLENTIHKTCDPWRFPYTRPR